MGGMLSLPRNIIHGASFSAREKTAAAKRAESPYHLLPRSLCWTSRKQASASCANACRDSLESWQTQTDGPEEVMQGFIVSCNVSDNLKSSAPMLHEIGPWCSSPDPGSDSSVSLYTLVGKQQARICSNRPTTACHVSLTLCMCTKCPLGSSQMGNAPHLRHAYIMQTANHACMATQICHGQACLGQHGLASAGCAIQEDAPCWLQQYTGVPVTPHEWFENRAALHHAVEFSTHTWMVLEGQDLKGHSCKSVNSLLLQGAAQQM